MSVCVSAHVAPEACDGIDRRRHGGGRAAPVCGGARSRKAFLSRWLSTPLISVHGSCDRGHHGANPLGPCRCWLLSGSSLCRTSDVVASSERLLGARAGRIDCVPSGKHGTTPGANACRYEFPSARRSIRRDSDQRAASVRPLTLAQRPSFSRDLSIATAQDACPSELRGSAMNTIESA